ncbi:DUF4446 family protein [Paenibacillus sp. YN15]|uniref:DUF4446 family protein n=1 Tax=Paenibacillus sp. YN15 TaxID=1742774 RepID=UPI000DCB504C|nr:DUF4446 family protein [Paenibacillus sp. YN15]RAU91786.1 DUF4446 domain-containing protein [Paenibacillus sp. YN15]
MDEMTTIIIFGAMGAGLLLVLILAIVALAKLSGMKKRYKKLIGNSAVENVDELLLFMQESINALQEENKQQADALNGIRNKMRTMKSNVAMKRYNAFSQQGSDLSFSIAITDENQNGLVLTGIHNREESYLYAKPVEHGASNYTLTPEEKEIIAQTAAQSQATGR